jgi:hypothetical protein
VCRRFSNGTFLVENFFNSGKSSTLFKEQVRTVGIMNAELKIQDNFIEFSFKRQIKMQPNLPKEYFDLSAARFYLLMAKGRLSKSNLIKNRNFNKQRF